MPGEAEKLYTGGRLEAQKANFYLKLRDPGLNHEPRVVFYAEFESGIENNQNLGRITEYNQFFMKI